MSKKKYRRKNSKKGKSPASSPAEGKAASPARKSPDPSLRNGCIQVDQGSNHNIDETRLFSQGTMQLYHDECPICMLPNSPDMAKLMYQTCCSTFICNGCWVAAGMDKVNTPCPFCRVPNTSNTAELLSRAHKRSSAGDADATHFLGSSCRLGHIGQKKDLPQAVKLYTKAAELGSTEAHFELGDMYRNGEGTKKSTSKSLYHLKSAAMNGHPGARYLLAMNEMETGRIDHTEVEDENAHRAVQHLVIAAKLGYTQTLTIMREFYSQQCITKETYLGALLGYQKAVEEQMSLQREIATKKMTGGRLIVSSTYSSGRSVRLCEV